jgi:hypothetical protein
MTPLQKDIYATASDFNARHKWSIEAAQALAFEAMTDANAHSEVRLWEAAPALLKALQGIMGACPSGWAKGFEDIELAAIQAIAKATGEQK